MSDTPPGTGWTYEEPTSPAVVRLGKIWGKQVVRADGVTEYHNAILVEPHHCNTWEMTHGSFIGALGEIAAPGGYVFVTKGLIDRCADESELAGILAHEITHVTSKPHLQAIRQSAMAGVGTQLLASQIRTSNIAGQLVKDQLLSLFRTVYTKGLSQSDEFEADRTGVSLAAKAGFDPYGLVSVLQQLRTVTPDNPMFTLTMSTHPAAQARLDYLEQSMGRQLDGLGGSRASIAQRLGGSAPANAPAPSARPAAAKKAG